MTSPSAQKAAGEIATRAIGRIQSECIGTQTGALAWKEAASIIQQAITEAVDAAVAPKEKRVKELEAALKPFARFACDDGKPAIGCACLNCIAARALEAPHEP